MKPLSETNTLFDPNNSISVSAWKRCEQVKKKKRSWNHICSRLWKTPWRTGWEIYIARRGAGGLSLIQSWSPVFLCLISRHMKSFVLNLRYLRYQCNKSRDKKKKKKRLQVSSKERSFIFTITAHDGVAFLRQRWDVTQIPLARHFLPLWDNLSCC